MQANYFGGHKHGQSEELSGNKPNKHTPNDGDRGGYVLMTTYSNDGRVVLADYRHEAMSEPEFRAAQQRQPPGPNLQPQDVR